MNENIIIEARQKFGLFFKELRKSKRLTQEQVGEACGVSLPTINKVELGRFPYSVDLLMKLSVVLGFTLNLEAKKEGKKERFLLQKSEREDYYNLTDIENEIVCFFEKGKFNETHSFSFLNDKTFNTSELATIMREFGDWLFENHRDLMFL